MFSKVFKKRARNRAGDHGVARPAPIEAVDIPVDDVMLRLHAELSALAHIDVAQAAKERGWATLSRELERHPVRRAVPELAKGAVPKKGRSGGALQPVLAGHSRSWRIAVSSAGVAVAIIAVVLGTYGAGLLTGGSDGPTVASNTTAASGPRTSVPIDVTTEPGGGTGITDVTSTTGATTPSDSVPPSTGSTGGVVTSEPTTPTTAGSGGTSVTTSPVTTVPAQTTTTNAQQYADAQRQENARAAVFDLADAVLAHFLEGTDLTGLRSMVPASVQSQLTQMVARLNAPTGYNKISVESEAGNKVRVVLEFTDVDPDRIGDDGQPLKIYPRFAITVQVGASATITAITFGS
jgi:hypothetical protein